MSAMSALPLRDDAAEPELLHWSAFGPPSDDFKVQQRPLGCRADFRVTSLFCALFCVTQIPSPCRSPQMLQPTLGTLWLQYGTRCRIRTELATATAHGVGSQVLINCRERTMELLRNMTRLLASVIRT